MLDKLPSPTASCYRFRLENNENFVTVENLFYNNSLAIHEKGL